MSKTRIGKCPSCKEVHLKRVNVRTNNAHRGGKDRNEALTEFTAFVVIDGEGEKIPFRDPVYCPTEEILADLEDFYKLAELAELGDPE